MEQETLFETEAEPVVTAGTRPIEPEMQLLWARLDTVCATFDDLIVALVGSRRGFTLMVHPNDAANATLSITNTLSNVEAVREWVGEMDRRATPGRLSDALCEATYGSREKYIEVCEANCADRESETFAQYVDLNTALGMELMTEQVWTAQHAEQLAKLRDNIRVNS